MKREVGIGTKLYALIIFVIIFIVGMCTFSWYTVSKFNNSTKERLEESRSYTILVDEARDAQVEFKIQVQEWKNVLLRGNSKDNFDKYYNQFIQSNTNVQDKLLKLKESMKNSSLDTTSVDTLMLNHKELFDKYSIAIKSYDINNSESYKTVDELVSGLDRQTTSDMDSLVESIESKSTEAAEMMIKTSESDKNTFTKYLIILVGLGLVATIVFTIIIMATYKGIKMFINQFKSLMEQAEKGDLTIKGEIHKKDELGEVTSKFNEFITSIRNLISETKEATETVALSSNEIMKTTDEISNTSQEVANTVSDLAESTSKQIEFAEQSNEKVKVVVEGLKKITTNSIYINKLTNTAIETVNSGASTLKEQIKIMDNTKDSSKKVSEVIWNLSTKSNEIGEVVEFINGITEQINLLSLNAAIEAARAGEAGRGFTVVANEVKKLAELSRESTLKISKLITEIQSDIKKSVEEVSNTNQSIDKQAVALKNTDDSLKKIETSVFEVTQKIKEVTAETEAINNSTSVVEEAIGKIVALIETNASSTEEVAASTEEHTASIEEISASMNVLTDLSNNLEKTIQKFKV
ncbi:methyl-accepting chemotaxis protein [Clostridium intestinale]|uniref:Methyl-accepting chemotaxis protein n=1 Tax=Clostridium intestinale URNW TaxID=1294142 RepID=U2PZ77_9CLOT|nr:methyl-accepting chemotaxis protein [Clostridium intestinale]ERK31825.1 Methyl-accepting chemotaxis protein [Clostridium intestinale URNW]